MRTVKVIVEIECEGTVGPVLKFLPCGRIETSSGPLFPCDIRIMSAFTELCESFNKQSRKQQRNVNDNNETKD